MIESWPKRHRTHWKVRPIYPPGNWYLLGTKKSHLWKRNIIFPATFEWDMLVLWRVEGRKFNDFFGRLDPQGRATFNMYFGRWGICQTVKYSEKLCWAITNLQLSFTTHRFSAGAGVDMSAMCSIWLEIRTFFVTLSRHLASVKITYDWLWLCIVIVSLWRLNQNIPGYSKGCWMNDKGCRYTIP